MAAGTGFQELGVAGWLREQLQGLGVARPTAVQHHCIPAILQGRDCLGVAKTGQGKTFAFALPILQKLSENPYGIYCLVLTPTRELALQIGDSFTALGRPMGLRVVVVTGGRDTVRQSQDLDLHVVQVNSLDTRITCETNLNNMEGCKDTRLNHNIRQGGDGASENQL